MRFTHLASAAAAVAATLPITNLQPHRDLSGPAPWYWFTYYRQDTRTQCEAQGADTMHEALGNFAAGLTDLVGLGDLAAALAPFQHAAHNPRKR